MPLIMRKSRIFAALEDTAGTPETLTTDDSNFSLLDFSVTPDINIEDRPQAGTFNMLPAVPGPYLGTATFGLLLSGNGATGAVPAWADVFLASCGLKKTTATFARAMALDDMPTLTIGHYVDGIRRMLVGAMGSCKITLNNGAPNRIDFEYRGKYWSESDATLLTGTDPPVKPPRGFQSLSVGAYALRAPTATIDFGQQVEVLEAPNDDQATGFWRAVVVDHRPKFTVAPYAELLATKDWHGILTAMTEGNLSAVVGSEANNIVTIAGTACQLTQHPWGDRSGLATRDLSFNINQGATIAFT